MGDAMTQPIWKLEWATDYSALYTDETGVYSAELEILEEVFDADASERFLVFRASLDAYKRVIDGDVGPLAELSMAQVHIVPAEYTPGWLVPMKYSPDWRHPIESYAPWWLSDLDSIAASVGRDPSDLLDDACSGDPSRLAGLYQDIAGYHGWENFDSYPLTISEAQADGWPDWRDVDEQESVQAGTENETCDE